MQLTKNYLLAKTRYRYIYCRFSCLVLYLPSLCHFPFCQAPSIYHLWTTCVNCCVWTFEPRCSKLFNPHLSWHLHCYDAPTLLVSYNHPQWHTQTHMFLYINRIWLYIFTYYFYYYLLLLTLVIFSIWRQKTELIVASFSAQPYV